MKTLKTLSIALVLSSMLFLGNPRCPEDSSDSFFTGKTRTSVAGKQMKEYKCYLYGHYFWASW